MALLSDQSGRRYRSVRAMRRILNGERGLRRVPVSTSYLINYDGDRGGGGQEVSRRHPRVPMESIEVGDDLGQRGPHDRLVSGHQEQREHRSRHRQHDSPSSRASCCDRSCAHSRHPCSRAAGSAVFTPRAAGAVRHATGQLRPRSPNERPKTPTRGVRCKTVLFRFMPFVPRASSPSVPIGNTGWRGQTR
jgi:hypothetical protein